MIIKNLFSFSTLLVAILITMQFFPLTKLAVAQISEMSLTVQPLPSITVDGEPVFPAQSESHQFEAGVGGTFDFVVTDGGSVKIVFSTGTTQATLDFFIDSYDQSAVIASRSLPAGRDVIGDLIYDMRTFEGLQTIVTFDASFAMTVGYTDEQVVGVDEETLGIYFWDESQSIWTAFDVDSRDIELNTITILSNHLTLFATLSETPQAVVPPPEDGGIIPTPIIQGAEPVEKQVTLPPVIKKIAPIRDVIESRDKDILEEREIIPRQLFDIDLSIDDRTISNNEELVGRVTLVNFGTEPTPINLIFTIVDEFGKELYAETEYIIVETEDVLTTNIDVRDLPPGKYTLVLHTLYNIDVDDVFRQSFEISKARKISGAAIVGTLALIAILIGGAFYLRKSAIRRKYNM